MLLKLKSCTVSCPLIFTGPLASHGMSKCLSSCVLTRSNLFLETSLQCQTALLEVLYVLALDMGMWKLSGLLIKVFICSIGLSLGKSWFDSHSKRSKFFKGYTKSLWWAFMQKNVVIKHCLSFVSTCLSSVAYFFVSRWDVVWF